MKKLVTILGANGVGKSTTSRMVNSMIPNSVYIDMEYCCRRNPFEYTDLTIPFIRDNIYSLISNSMKHACVEVILFPYGLHGARNGIYNDVMNKLTLEYRFDYYPIVLECSIEENAARMRKDNRDDACIKRALSFSDAFKETTFPRINTTGISVEEVARIVISMIQ